MHAHCREVDPAGVHPDGLLDGFTLEQRQDFTVDFDPNGGPLWSYFLLKLEARLKGVPVVAQSGAKGLLETVAELVVLPSPIPSRPEGSCYVSRRVKVPKTYMCISAPSSKLPAPHLENGFSQRLQAHFEI